MTTLAALLAVAGLLSGCPGAPGEPEAEVAGHQTAEKLLQLTDVHEDTAMALLEGPTSGRDGDLYVVDVTAPAGAPNVQRVDVGTRVGQHSRYRRKQRLHVCTVQPA